ncbi:MAG: reverse transcriptase domain-containing protein [Longicatena sp.]
MNPTKLTTKLEGFRTRNSANHCYVNKDIYRIFYSRELYYIAYNKIKSNDGAETLGSDNTSLHGFCEEWIDELISSLRDESYRPNPNKTVYIPKKNGKMRKLSFPNGKDKLIQECIRMILECIYEPTFSNFSHGFRPHRSIDSAIAQIDTWKSTTWFMEGDIKACFDEVDHNVLIDILQERVNDVRFINLIRKLLNAGYFDTDLSFHKSKQGAMQGSSCSPILANIYLDKLDRFMEDIIERDTKGNYRKQNPIYASLLYKLKKAQANDDDSLVKSLTKQLKDVKSIDIMDSSFRRVKYVRYADDFLIGIIANKAYVKQLKQEIKVFLEEVLHLRLSDEKTKITNASDGAISFLGFLISKPKSHIAIELNKKDMIQKLHQNGMCESNGYPIGITYLLRNPIEEIITYGNQVLRGLLYSKQGCHNYYEGWRIQYIIQYSIAKTIARKYNISMKNVFKKYGDRLTYTYTNAKGMVKTIRLALFKSFKRNKYYFSEWLHKIKEPLIQNYKTSNPMAKKCSICGNPQNQKMFHRKRKKLLKSPYTHIEHYMVSINRRQICVCSECFDKLSSNQLEYNQINQNRKHI